MAFSSLSIEQITFEADDTRLTKLKSFESLVNYDSEFPNKESLVFNKSVFRKLGKKSQKKQPQEDSSSLDEEEDEQSVDAKEFHKGLNNKNNNINQNNHLVNSDLISESDLTSESNYQNQSEFLFGLFFNCEILILNVLFKFYLKFN